MDLYDGTMLKFRNEFIIFSRFLTDLYFIIFLLKTLALIIKFLLKQWRFLLLISKDEGKMDGRMKQQKEKLFQYNSHLKSFLFLRKLNPIYLFVCLSFHQNWIKQLFHYCKHTVMGSFKRNVMLSKFLLCLFLFGNLYSITNLSSFFMIDI